MLSQVPWGKVLWSVPLSIAFVDNVASVVPTTGLAVSPLLPSMPWTLDFCFVTKENRANLSPGDIVSMANPSHPGRTLVKRLVALENDAVRLVPGDWRIEKLEQIRRGCCWVVDDNDSAQDDSRTIGQVPSALLEGKVRAVLRFQPRSPVISTVVI
jgi:hypothetical protein